MDEQASTSPMQEQSSVSPPREITVDGEVYYNSRLVNKMVLALFEFAGKHGDVPRRWMQEEFDRVWCEDILK